MKNILLNFLLVLIISPMAEASRTKPAQLRYSVDFIFSKVLEKKRQKFRAEIPFPPIHFASKTSLKLFQDAIESQWGMRPDFITNAFSVSHNMIFMSDDANYYRRTGRCMDDSLVHELVHYVQVKYQGWDLHDESLEWEAVDIQREFREEFCKK